MKWTVRGWRRLPLLIGLALVVGMLTAAPAWAVETRQGDRIEVGPGEVVNDDLYAFGNTVTVDGTVEGDLVASGSRVIVNGTVEDDARIAGQALVLGENANIADDLFAAGYSLENRAGSNIGGSLFYGGYQALLAGTIEENFQAGVGALELRGEVGGDINAALGEAEGGAPQFLPGSPVSIPAVEPGLTLTDSARVAGLLIYVVLSAIPIVDTLTGLLVVLLGVGAVSGWLWKAIRPGNIATAEPSANGSVAEESVPDRQLMKD